MGDGLYSDGYLADVLARSGAILTSDSSCIAAFVEAGIKPSHIRNDWAAVIAAAKARRREAFPQPLTDEEAA